ncbi:hypothetical protein, partial [Oerskovia paurometabola]|uniref:hypothetical protein n=1 Tax=Oerskovia paurometabola TaxID=162170 RepID=UPI003428D92F
LLVALVGVGAVAARPVETDLVVDRLGSLLGDGTQHDGALPPEGEGRRRALRCVVRVRTSATSGSRWF